MLTHIHIYLNIFFSWCFWINLLLTLSSRSDGTKGSGKTMSLCHAVHFCYTKGWLVLHIPDGETNTIIHNYWHNFCCRITQSVTLWPLLCFFHNTAHLWVKNCKELLPSSYNTSRFDQPLQATEWLRNFRITNELFLSKVDFTSVIRKYCNGLQFYHINSMTLSIHSEIKTGGI